MPIPTASPTLAAPPLTVKAELAGPLPSYFEAAQSLSFHQRRSTAVLRAGNFHLALSGERRKLPQPHYLAQPKPPRRLKSGICPYMRSSSAGDASRLPTSSSLPRHRGRHGSDGCFTHAAEARVGNSRRSKFVSPLDGFDCRARDLSKFQLELPQASLYTYSIMELGPPENVLNRLLLWWRCGIIGLQITPNSRSRTH